MVDDIYLRPSPSIDSDHPTVLAFAEQAAGLPPIEAAKSLYLAVRDGFRYNPWNIQRDPEAYRASAVLARARQKGGHCIDKGVVLAASARALGIPARLHFANVRNHIGTADLEAKLGTDLLVFHGYVGLHLDGRWVAATPAFNIELCRHLGVEPLAFDGRRDSVFQAYDRKAGRFMEYVEDHGHFPDIPFDRMFAQWALHYGFTRDSPWPPRS